MSYYAIEERTLQDIADAIRFKDGTTDPIYGVDLGYRVWCLEKDSIQFNGDDFSPNNTSTAKYVFDEWNLQDIADAIRYFEDTSDPIPVSEMAQRIAYLPSKMWKQCEADGCYYSDVHFANGVWVASDWDYGLQYSTDGVTWTRSNITNHAVNSVYYANGLWVAAAELYGMLYSTDGKMWSYGVIEGYGQCMDVYYGNGDWVAGCYNGIYYSTDGITWVHSNNTSRNINNVYYANGVWLASSSNSLWFSTNGVIWELKYEWDECSGLYYGGGLWFVNPGSCCWLYSTDGVTWNDTNLGYDEASNICYGNGLWVAAGYYDILYSFDGVTWTYTGAGVYDIVRDYLVYYANGLWVCGSGMFSKDGINWIDMGQIVGRMHAFHYEDGLLVGAADYGMWYAEV